MRRAALPMLAIGIVLAGLIVALQVAAGAYRAEFGEDETSHYASALMLHDYLAGGAPQSPLAYVRMWHSHYPLVGIGHWPPLFYAVTAVWMLAFSPGHLSMLLLSATVTLAVSLLLYSMLRPSSGTLLAAAAAVLLAASPLIRDGSNALMLDVPTALACLLAAGAYGRFLRTGRARDSALFALLAVAAMMVKGNGACLALLPPAAVLIGRRLDLLRRAAFWLPLPIVAVLAGPWYWLTYQLAAAGFRFPWGLAYVEVASAANLGALLHAFGPPIVLLGAAGFVWTALRPRAAGPVAVGAAALFAAVWIFQSVVPAALQDRYLAPALPPLLILAVRAGTAALGRLLPTHPAPARALLAGVLAATFLLTAAAATGKDRSGIAEAVALLLEHPVPGNPAILLAADSLPEEQAVTEIALQDSNRPHLFAVRGVRLLGGGGYNDQDYEPRFQTPAQVMAAIDALAIPTVLVRADGGPREWEHVRQVQAAIAAYPDRWHLFGRIDIPHTAPVLLYRLSGNDTRPAKTAGLLALSAPHGL